MIYFSDLDRTLIYSNKFINENTKQVCVEVIDEEEISYMSPKSIESLKSILKIKKLIPTTTRSIEQYKRIKFSEHEINFDWSIVTNGGNILYKGEIYKPWTEELKKQLEQCESLDTVNNYFINNYGNIEGITKIKSVDEIFFYIVVDQEIFRYESLSDFEKYLKEKNWSLYVNGRKIYFLPSVVTKENAIKYLVETIKAENFGALGDSIMDLNMLKESNKAFIPANSYITKLEETKDMYISKNEGFSGIEEILEVIYSI